MADRFPLILNTSANQIQEIASGDTLDLSGNNVANAGIITATSFSGPIVAGAGTSNIVSGIITAVAADIDDFVDVGSNIQLGNAGVITATTFKGDGDFVELDVDGHTNLDNVSVAGVTTFNDNVHFKLNDKLYFGNNNELEIYQQGNNTFIYNNDDTFVIAQVGQGANHPMRIHGGSEFELKHYHTNGGQNSVFKSIRGGAFTLYHAAPSTPSAEHVRLETASTGINFPRDIDVDGHTNLDNLSVAGVSTFTGNADFSSGADITGTLNVAGVIDSTVAGGDNELKVETTSSGDPRINLAASGSGGHHIEYIRSSNTLNFKQAGGSVRMSIAADGTVDVNRNLNANLGLDVTGNTTVSGDIDVDGHTNLDNVSVAGVSTFSSNITLPNNISMFFGDGGTKIFGTAGGGASNGLRFFTDSGGSLFIDGNHNVYVQQGNLSVSGNLSVGGVLTYEDVTNVDSVGIVTARQGIEIKNDTYKLRTGAELEMQVFHDGSNSIIKDTRDSGKVRIQADNFDIIDKDASTTVFSAAPGGISSPKIHTFSAGATVSGGTLYVGNSSYGSSLGQLRIINDASSTPASLSLFGHGNTTTGDVFAKIDFASQESGNGGQVTAGIEAQAVGTAERGADLVFKTRPDTNGSSASSRFRIRSTGMVGVGVDDPAVAGGYHGMEIGGTANSGLRLSVTSNGGWAFTDYEINGTQAYIVGCKGGTDSLSPASSWRICSGASFDANQLFVVNANGSVLPGSDNTQDFGSSSFRWANIYTGDLNLSNEGTVNDVDGTWGNFQIQEGENDLFLINKRSGKKYKFNLTEV